MMQPEEFMREAIALADRSVELGGGPFGAVVVCDGEIVGRGHNRVTLDNDPTAHAEVQAIREACRRLERFSLEGCELYVNCEPCPMCLAAIYWARLEAVHFAAEAEEAAAIGFDDVYVASELARPWTERRLRGTRLLRDEALEVFARWRQKPDKVEY